ASREDDVSLEAIRVLIVEDDPLFIKLVSSMLMTRDFAVEGVSAAEDAVEILRSQSFELLITDLKMDGIGGVGLIRTLIEDHLFPTSRVLVITGEPHNSEDSAWVAGQNIPILQKPFTVKSLLSA